MKRLVTVIILTAAVVGCRQAPSSLADAQDCLKNRDLACAAENLEGYLKLNPHDAAASGMLGIVLTQTRDHERAVEFHRKAIAGGIKDAQMMANYGGSLEALGDHEGAILANKQALELNPTLVDVAMATASQLHSLGRPGEAAQLLQSFDDRQVAMGAKAHFEPIIKIMKENAEATAQQPAAN